MQELIYDTTSGIKDSPVVPEKSLNKIQLKSRTHYVFYAGEPGDGGKGISQIQYRNGLTFIRRGVVEQVNNFAYWDRDQEDRAGMPAVRHPDPRRQNEVRQVLYAADIVEFLTNLWGPNGLVSLSAAIGIEDGARMKAIVKQILPVVPATNTEMRQMIETALEDFELDSLEYKIGEDMLKAIAAAEFYGRSHLASMKSEMEMHRVGKDGIAALDSPARRWIKILGLSAADYEVDSQNIQQAIGAALNGGSREPIIVQQAAADPNIIAAAVMAAMQHLKEQGNIIAPPAPPEDATPEIFGPSIPDLGTVVTEAKNKKGK